MIQDRLGPQILSYGYRLVSHEINRLDLTSQVNASNLVFVGLRFDRPQRGALVEALALSHALLGLLLQYALFMEPVNDVLLTTDDRVRISASQRGSCYC